MPRLSIITLTVLVLGLVTVLACVLYSSALHTAHEAFAKEQIQFFDECRDQALASTPAPAAALLESITQYYPSGSKQDAGSPLDWVVEHERQRAITDIINDLKHKTGEDLGPTSAAWVAKYASPR